MDECVAIFLENVVKEILLRCLVKSLLRFKCIHKNWYDLIKIPKFVQQHLNYSKNNPPQLLLYNSGNLLDDHDSCSLTLLSEDIPQTIKGMTYLLGSMDDLFFMTGVIDHMRSYVLWNPITREGSGTNLLPFNASLKLSRVMIALSFWQLKLLDWSPIMFWLTRQGIMDFNVLA
ncbi:hypothetical protein H5410_057336 [Solanum commersonii]|uniref:Uncharacterized protein n=1 Tax=Solanum commersonii TaxID=4109 RepID=A0A9J5WNR4_SOLCO|nr:hypothetical protein H5410_057336 [Solanum commersonii]